MDKNLFLLHEAYKKHILASPPLLERYECVMYQCSCGKCFWMFPDGISSHDMDNGWRVIPRRGPMKKAITGEEYTQQLCDALEQHFTLMDSLELK